MNRFNLELLQTVLAPIMPMVRIEDQIIVLGSLEHVVSKDDGSLELYFASNRLITLSPKEAAILSNTLETGLKRAQEMQRQQRAAELFGLNNQGRVQ